MGRQCQIEMVEPATDLTPPMPERPAEVESLPSLGQPNLDEDKEQSNTEANRTSTPIVNSHQGHLEVSEDDDESKGTTVEPLGPIIITDPPTTVEPAATAGKWPTESPTESPITDSDADNEA